MNVLSLFDGISCGRIALERAGIEVNKYYSSEIDKYAIKAYEAIHGSALNLGDISKIKVEDVPQHDLFTYSFPCQDLSVAGKQAGLGKGTRSGLLYECEKIIEYCRPKYLLLENVKNLVGKKFKPQFDEWLDYLESLGYTNYWKVLNAKDYGVPQNRERVFVVSILGDHEPYEFPDKMGLDKCIADVLEDEVDEKYYLSEEIQNRFKITNQNKNIIGTTKPDFRTIGQRDLVYDKNGIMGALVATDYKQPKQIAEINNLGMLDIKGNEQIRRVYGTDGISPALTTMQGGNRQPKILEGLDYRIRKLTPRECFRLMGMNDCDIDKIQATGLSNTQQYKMAGNSIVVNVLEAIFKELFL